LKVLVIGSGGREHALAWKIASSPARAEVICAPGNGGTAGLGVSVPVSADDVDALEVLAADRGVDLVVIGPEGPLVGGLADRLRARGIPVFGPGASGARLEGSKAFAKRFMARHGIPTAAFRVFEDPVEASAHVAERPLPMVVKADGLAAGKGVTVCRARSEATAAVREAMRDRRFGEAGASVVVEDCLEGEEASLLVVTDGRRFVTLRPAQDHKRVGDGDTGPNTGGMGAYCPAPVLDERRVSEVVDRVVEPTLAGLRADGIPFSGCLYVGLMMAGGESSVLEYNVRFGDPETQPVLAHLESDLVPLLLGAARGDLGGERPVWRAGSACCVVMAAQGYPGDVRRGDAIEGLGEAEAVPGVTVFHAGTRRDEAGRVLTAGGRVLGVIAVGSGLGEARDRAYAAVGRIRWPGAFHRTDISARGLGRVLGTGRSPA
jgi:phosphoribosylamine--glycine ligase